MGLSNEYDFSKSMLAFEHKISKNEFSFADITEKMLK
jgi:hypothetical protein